MYKEYFHLQCEPFNITPDPRFLYMTAQHQEALNHLLYGIRQRKGFICLTGEVGAGKTTLCRQLLSQLRGECHTALILNPMLTGTQLLRAVLAEFGVQTRRQDRLGCLNELNRFLLGVSVAGRVAVLIIDEAQDMPLETLELTRLLSNLETDSQKLLQILLVGQPELRDRLAKPSLRQLAQRIAVRYHLGTLSRDDTAQYIRHRLWVAGGPERASATGLADGDPAEVIALPTGGPIAASPTEPTAAAGATEPAPAPGASEPAGRASPVQFDEGAISEIFHYSRGTPRLINSLGDKALLAGYVHGTDRIDRRLVRLAAEEMKESLR
jgi:general secretion pathway protein A